MILLVNTNVFLSLTFYLKQLTIEMKNIFHFWQVLALLKLGVVRPTFHMRARI